MARSGRLLRLRCLAIISYAAVCPSDAPQIDAQVNSYLCHARQARSISAAAWGASPGGTSHVAAMLPFKGDCEARQARDACADAGGRGIADTSHVTWPGDARMSRIIRKTGQQGQYPLRRPCCSCSGRGRGGGHRRSCHGSCRGLLPLLRTLFCPGPALVSSRPKHIHVEVAPLVLQEKHGRA